MDWDTWRRPRETLSPKRWKTAERPQFRLVDWKTIRFANSTTRRVGVDFILAGHTHLERALRRRKRRGFYFNSGTWARLIRLSAPALADQAEFNKVYGALAAGTMDALEGFTIWCCDSVR